MWTIDERRRLAATHCGDAERRGGLQGIENDLPGGSRLVLHSDNPAFALYAVAGDDVIEVWRAAAYLSFELPSALTANRRRRQACEVHWTRCEAKSTP